MNQFIIGSIPQTNASATVDGKAYSRYGAAPGVSTDVATVFVQVGRTPMALANGGYWEPVVIAE